MAGLFCLSLVHGPMVKECDRLLSPTVATAADHQVVALGWIIRHAPATWCHWKTNYSSGIMMWCVVIWLPSLSRNCTVTWFRGSLLLCSVDLEIKDTAFSGNIKEHPRESNISSMAIRSTFLGSISGNNLLYILSPCRVSLIGIHLVEIDLSNTTYSRGMERARHGV